MARSRTTTTPRTRAFLAAARIALPLLAAASCVQPVTGVDEGSGGTGGSSSTGGSNGGGGAIGTGGATGGFMGSGGATGAGGSSATGGSTGAAGARGTGGAGGRLGSGGSGSGGSGTAGSSGSTSCTITAQTTMSTAIPTVAVVTWSTTLTGLTKAEIDFGPSSTGPSQYVAPVDLTQPSYRTLLLGMKGSTGYVFHIVATSSAGSCTSQDYTLTTGAVASNLPKQTATISDAAAHDHGFIVTSSGLSGSSAYILDADGSVVWWATAPTSPSRVHMSWDGNSMYMMSLNVMNNNSGKIETVNMDGTGLTTVSGMTTSHHDLTAIPGGFATLLWNKSGTDAPCSLVEHQDSSGTNTTIVADMGTLYNSSTFHTNAIHYYPTDDSYTVGDRNPDLYVKLSRAGALIWQFGGKNPKDPSKFFSGVPTWSINHGHQLLTDGTFLFFNNGANEAWEYQLDTSNMTATSNWHYTASGATSQVLGDVQRLPNGNILVTFSTSGQIHEVDPSGKLVAKFTGGSYGYSEFRESLYGPPPY
jgi:Arylsulfotransferase (ASST)